VIRSDEVRKQLCGVPSLARLGPEGYTADISSRVYATMGARAELIVRSGRSVTVDAVFARSPDREAIERTAAAANVPFAGIWLDAPESRLVARVERRHADPSDADAGVVRRQLADDLGTMTWHRLNASAEADAVLRQAIRVLAIPAHTAPGGIEAPHRCDSAGP
jgi:predicted kinase